MKRIISILTIVPNLLLGVSFETMKLSQEINVNALETSNDSLYKTNQTTIIKGTDVSDETMQNVSTQNVHGIRFDIYDYGNIDFNFGDTDLAGGGMERIMINGKSLLDCIDERISLAMSGASPRAITNIVSDMVYNPLWGKKLAVIGDSLITAPSASQSYPSFIAKRNNMTIVHKGRGGERLCTDVTNSTGQITNMSCIKSYTNDIPADADYILCQIGANDSTRWQLDVSEGVDDTDMSLNTFKGCFNNLLIGLRKNYPNAKLGMVLANNWADNLGQKSEDTPSYQSESSRGGMIKWQKIQCQKLNIPVFDPVDDTRKFTYNYVTYPTNGTTITSSSIDESELSWYDRTKIEIGTVQRMYSSSGYWIFQSKFMEDWQHTSAIGNLYLSYFYEFWMKTEVASSY